MTEPLSISIIPLQTYSLLISMQAPPITPFRLITQHGTITCCKVLRFLLGKRMVALAEQNGQPCIIKCFFGKNANRYFQRELAGINGFIRSGADTPALIRCSDTDEQGGLHILTQYLGEVRSLADILEQDIAEKCRMGWLQQSARLLAKLHKAGVCQQDIHLDNMLVSNDRLYMIDGGGASVSLSPLTSKRCFENLALFMAVLYPRYDCFADSVLTDYASENSLAADWTKKTLLKKVYELRKWRERFIQKSLRNCTEFRVEKSNDHFAAFTRVYDEALLQSLIANPETYIANGKILKHGKTNTVAIVSLDDGNKVLIKKYQSTKGFLHAYLRPLRSSRARKAWLNGHLLRFLGVDTPAPMAMLEHRSGPAVTCSYVVTEFVPSTHAMAYFNSMQEPLAEWPQAASAIGDMLVTLKRSSVYHGDLKGNNFLIKNHQPQLIDLDAMISYKWRFCFQRRFRKDLERFSRNWIDNPNAKALFQPIINAWKEA